MRKTNYPEALAAIAGGFTMLFASIVNTILDHKALTAFIISFIVNIVLIFSLMNARGERDKYNAQLYRTECQRDSLSILIER